MVRKYPNRHNIHHNNGRFNFKYNNLLLSRVYFYLFYKYMKYVAAHSFRAVPAATACLLLFIIIRYYDTIFIIYKYI